MKTYNVYQPSGLEVKSLERADALVFVKDGFSWFAFLLPPFWIISQRLWRVLAVYIGVLVFLITGLNLAGAAPDMIFWVLIAFHLLIGFEASSLQAWTLEKRKFKLIHVVSGQNLEECERQFFTEWLKISSEKESINQSPFTKAPQKNNMLSGKNNDPVGLFPTPGINK